MSTNDQLQQAYQLIRAGSRQEAVQILMSVLKADQSNADAWWLLANAVTDPSQQRRALNEVLKRRPGDEKATRMLNNLAPAETFPSAVDPFDTTPAYTPPRAAQPSPIADPFAGSDNPFGEGQDPFAPGRKPQSSVPPSFAQPTPSYPVSGGNVPPAPIYMGPSQRRGPSCCLLSGCLVVVLFCIAPLLCVGAGLAGLSPVFNDVARTAGASDFQGLFNVFSGQATPLPGSALDDAFSQLGVSNFNELQGTMQSSIDQMATLAGTPGAFGSFIVGEAFTGTPVNRGNIESGQSISGTVGQNSTGDAFVLTASAGTTYVIDAVGVDGVDTTLTIVNNANTVVAFNDDGGSGTNAQLVFTADSSAKYTIVVGTFGSGGGSYTLTVETR
jgi:hypothetical protein